MDTSNKEVNRALGAGGMRCCCCGGSHKPKQRRAIVRAARRREKARDLREREVTEWCVACEVYPVDGPACVPLCVKCDTVCM